MRKFVIAFLGWCVMSGSYGQDIPPQCKQFMVAYSTCARAYISAIKKTHPEELADTQKQLDPEMFDSAFKESLRRNGWNKTTLICEGPEFRQGMSEAIAIIVKKLIAMNSPA